LYIIIVYRYYKYILRKQVFLNFKIFLFNKHKFNGVETIFFFSMYNDNQIKGYKNKKIRKLWKKYYWKFNVI